MANNVFVTPLFDSKRKRLSRKFPSINSDLFILEDELKANPQKGTSLGANLYKVRVANTDKQSGKSRGYRVISYLVEQTLKSTDIYLITIYDKSEESTILKSDLVKMVSKIFGK